MDESILNSGVTIVTSTIRQQLMENVFRNYARQSWGKKELIIVINRDNMNIERYKKMASLFSNVSVFRQSETKLLGDCLNFATSIAKYPYIAKFDDDDYYGSQYITEAMRLFAKTDADLVGKRSCYFYFPHKSVLMYRKTATPPNSKSNKIAGATIMYNKRVFKKVKFVKAKQGTDTRFVKACLEHGYKIYTTSKFNFAAIRRRNSNSHTWKISDRQLLANRNSVSVRTKTFTKFVNRPLTPGQKASP